jgi:hypothetical protein
MPPNEWKGITKEPWRRFTDEQLLAGLPACGFVLVNVRLVGDDKLHCTKEDIDGEDVIMDVFIHHPSPNPRDWDSLPCDLCGKRYIAWWVLRDQWHQLPQQYRNKCLCLYCYAAKCWKSSYDVG